MAICPEVLNEAEHALGNLFQRIHHIARVAREGMGPNAERMVGALSDLQEILDLLFDYVMPVSLERRPVGCDRVAESLVSNLSSYTTQEVNVGSTPAASIDIDTRVLSRSLQVLAKARTRELAGAQSVNVAVAQDDARTTVDMTVTVYGAGPMVLSGDVDLAWEVAARLIELQGGELRQSATGSSLAITLSFPVSG